MHPTAIEMLSSTSVNVLKNALDSALGESIAIPELAVAVVVLAADMSVELYEGYI